MNYGIEYEFFVQDSEGGQIVPAFNCTNNLDGYPVIGELKTGIHSTLVDAVFELKKLIFIEKKMLESIGFSMLNKETVTVSKSFLEDLRNHRKFSNNKEYTYRHVKSIYNKRTSKTFPRGVLKASLQINISKNNTLHYTKCVGEERNMVEHTRTYSNIFDFPSLIFKLDEYFKKEIRESNRIQGLYCIKDGKKGERIEYRSLPSDVDLIKLANLII